MMRPLATLIKDLLGTAERQVEAARGLDRDGLEAASERRQDLYFELQILLQETGKLESDTIRADLLKLGQLDHRLRRILSSANAVFSEVLGFNTPPTYGADGRIAIR
jgi:hypothetical protein